MKQNPPLPTQTQARARSLRSTPTDAESAIWFHLRAGRLLGLKFRRQHPIPPYIVDFYCETAKLIVEFDGSQHTADSDEVRTMALERQGLRIVRFWDNDVLQQTESVLAAIL